MNLRTLLLLLGVVAALAAVLWFTDRKQAPLEQPLLPVLGGRSFADIEVLRWQFAAQDMIEIRRTDPGEYRLTEPLQDLASAAVLRVIADAFSSANMIEFRPGVAIDDAMLRETGLQQPRAWFEAEFRTGKVRLELGSSGPLGYDLFVRRDDRIYTGGQSLLTSLQVGREDLRESQVFRNTVGTATRVAVTHRAETGQSEELVLERSGNDWRLVAPVRGRTNAAGVASFLAQVLSLRVESFAPSVLKPPSEQPDFAVRIQGARGEEVVRLWRSGATLFGEVEARRIAFQVDRTQVVDVFVNALGMLRARWLIPGEALQQEVVRVVVDRGTGMPRLVVQRASPTLPWRLAEPAEALADDTAVAELLSALNHCWVLEFVAGDSKQPSFGLSPAPLQVSVFRDGVREPTVLWFGNDTRIGDNEATWCVRADETEQVVTVPRQHVEQLRRPWQRYVHLDVQRQTAPVPLLVLERGEQRRELRHGELPILAEVIDELRDLRADAAELRAGPRFTTPAWTLRMCRQNGDTLNTLAVFEVEGDGRLWVAPQDAPLVYALKPRLSDDLRRLWRD